jgi:hypothetical protein
VEYMLLINVPDSPAPPSEEESSGMLAEFMKYTRDLEESGALVASDRLQPPQAATTVRVKDGEALTTDGPFAETKEWLGGYYKIDVETLDDAIEWASRIPSVKYGGAIEVRPIHPVPADFPSSP